MDQSMEHYRYNDAFTAADIYARQLANQPPIPATAEEKGNTVHRYAYHLPVDPANDRLTILLLLAASQKVDETAKFAGSDTELKIEFSNAHSKAPVRQIRHGLEKIKEDLLFCFKLEKDGQYHFRLDTTKTPAFISYTNLLNSAGVDPKQVTNYYHISVGHRIILTELDGSKRLIAGKDVPEELFDRCAKQWATKHPEALPLLRDRWFSHVSLTPEAFQTVATQLGFMPSPISKRFMN